jgi:putative peptide zinc metalloprotease protein
MTPAAPKKQEVLLPPLRGDLRLMAGTASTDGSPTWVIVDPVRGKYFQIGWAAYQILSRWGAKPVEELLAEIHSDTICRATKQDVDDLLRFLYANNLMRDPPRGGYRAYVEAAEASRPLWVTWLVHRYLFFQIPLFQPDRFLRATLPFVGWLYSRAVAWVVGGIGLVGLYLISRQWDVFKATFLHFFTLRGLALYGLCLIIVKVFHELGHAYTATRYGCRVPTMGIAVLVMAPMLYSDTSDAWKLTSRRQRAAIGAAGMIVECALAAVALFAWNFLDDGVARSLAFIVATTSLMVGAAINLSPLMRFDGYYVLSDLLGIPNLHDRAFAFGQWQLRRLLFGLDTPMPEPVTPARRRFLTCFAWMVWGYRFALFLGVALLVYHYFFKLLGIVLFAIEIGWFIVLPIMREVKVWWALRATIRERGRVWALAGMVASLAAVLFVPWSNRIQLPGVLEAIPHATIYTPAAGKITELVVKQGQWVEAGAPLIMVEAPTIEKDIALTRKRIEVERLRAQRQSVDAEKLADTQVTVETLRAHLFELEGFRKKQQTLYLTAPMAGFVTDRADGLHVGRWINTELSLAYIVDPQGEELHALVEESMVKYLQVGQSARFIPDSVERPSLSARVQEIRDIDESSFTVPYLASLYGGGVPVQEDANHRLKPETSVYRVTLQLANPPPRWAQAVRGTVLVEGPRISLARRAWEQSARVLIRESGV